MNEQIRIRLTSQGQPLPIDLVDAADPVDRGVVLRNELSAAPRRLALQFAPFGAPTEMRIRNVRQRMAWSSNAFPLHVTGIGDGLAITGVRPDTLPAGIYEGRLAIDDLRLSNAGRFRVELKDNGRADAVLDAVEDPRQVRLTMALDAFPSGLRRLLTAATSKLDGMPASEWLDSLTARASRKACLLNVLGKLAADVPSVLDTVDGIFFADVDRVYTEVTPQCAAVMRQLANGANQPFIGEGPPAAGIHRRLLRKANVADADYDMNSYRQRGSNCLQVVVASPKPGRGDRHVAEFDIDLGNAREDAVGFLVHFGEVINPGRTDHFKLRDKLLNTAAGAFLPYDIVEPHVTARIVDGV